MATIEDVAKRAGVSLSTVSYALSGKRPVAEKTRQRILAIVEELDYHPNVVASRLASRRSHTIGVMYPTEMSSLSERQLELVLSIARTATRYGYSLMLWSASLKADEVWKLTRQHLLEGVILTEIKWHDARVDLLKAKGFPFVMIGHCADSSGISFVDLDFYETLRMCVRYLAGQGHQRIAFFNASPEMIKQGYSVAIRAQQGFEQAIAECGLTGQIVSCRPTPRHAYELTQELLKQRPRVTGLIMIIDQAAAGITQAVQDAGLHIPEDISLVSNFGPRAAELIYPPLTGLDIPEDEDLGVAATEILIGRLEGRIHAPVQTFYAPHLAARQSSGPPRP